MFDVQNILALLTTFMEKQTDKEDKNYYKKIHQQIKKEMDQQKLLSLF